MIVAYKNNGWKPDLNDNSQRGYYPYFYKSPFLFFSVNWCDSHSSIPASLLLQSEALVRETVEEFLPELQDSRQTLAY